MIITAGCVGKEINIENFDQEAWKEDQFGCNNKRQDLYQTLLNNKEELLGLNNREIIDFLGKPDKTELYTRNQKFFHYYITPGNECDKGGKPEDPSLLSFRFNATGFVNEITLFN